MRNRFLKSLFAASASCFLLFSSGCTQEPAASSGLEHRSIYVDYRTLETDSFILEVQKPECTNAIYEYKLNVSFEITNKEEKKSKYSFKDLTILDETKGGKYKVTSETDSLDLEPSMSGSFTFSSKIPLSITEHKYKLSFDMNGYQIDYHLYERPDDARAEWKVNFFVDGALVKTGTVRDGKAPDHYAYESSDLLSYCRDWYTDEAKTKYFTFPTPVTSNINLYGDSAPCYKWDTSSYADYAYLHGVNYVPANGTLMLPRHYENKEIYIGSYAITGTSIEILYIPITVRRIEGSGNFQKKSMAIYYEGTEEQWNSVLQNSKSNPPNLIFMNGSGFPY